MEAKWKVFQYALADRIRVIEAYFRDEKELLLPSPVPFQAYNFWYKSYSYDLPIFPYEKEKGYRPKKLGHRTFRAAFQTFVMLPYVAIILLSLVSLSVLLFA